ncbi:phenylacetate-CoA oxygenase subunit PaaJ [Corynebacterium uropygiale]|uniref:Phenylacetate-CoA oxygenase subunit PaaJ n=1 Tax=Corynebacterium uropygiale TaxID=1775911 RepID=A0A9X1QTR5_9CORY|nr:1,2-phenylacetyl-CoA epoxidase subunit PaaD [Corynebacterium uropygiale]MCF4007673.1 phenylacetate-CoA oxygenase subunit PaaJ [Corynebacterium uropygiale]
MSAPHDPRLARIWEAAARVPDPEIPVLSIADLGILREVRQEDDGTPVVIITPTYSGCPAMGTIAADVKEAVGALGMGDPRVEFSLSPAWSTEWITEAGREALRAYGIAPPVRSRRPSGPVPLSISFRPPVPCPRCGSTNTRLLTDFGSTSCKALYTCRDCLEPFDYFKEH